MTEKTGGLTRREFVRQVGLGTAALAVASALPQGISAASTIKNGMGYRTLGRTGLEVSEVALGAGSISPSGGNLVRAALSQGINLIETSGSHVQAETAIGQVVKSMGNRDRVVILTKTGNLEVGRLLSAPASEVEKAVRDELEGSLKRLQTDYVDLYISPYMTNTPSEATLPALQEALEKLKKEGKIRFTGLSTHFDYVNICVAVINGGFYDVIIFPINIATLVPHIRNAVLESKKAGESAKSAGMHERPIIDIREVLKAAQQKKLGVIGIKGAQEGFLPVGLRDQIKDEFAKGTKLSFHQFAYRFVLDQPQVSAVSIRMANMLHLNEALVLSQKTLMG